MKLKKLHYTVDDGIAVVQLDYPKNLNAIDEEMADELLYVVQAAVGRPLQINGSRDSCISPHVRAPTRLNLSGPFGPPLLAGEAKSFPSASP